MHIIIGGAFNGKRKWVNEYYKNKDEIHWFSGTIEELQEALANKETGIVAIEQIERWTKQWLVEHSLDEAREVGREWIQAFSQWEQENPVRRLVLVGTDFSKGIVPIEKEDRDWRDLTGWFYQDLVKEATRVDEIWYGLGQQLK